MFDRFSDNAKRLMSCARKEAMGLGHELIAPEHMLLGLLQVSTCRAVDMLAHFGIDWTQLREEILATMPRGTSAAQQLPFTAKAKKVLEFTLETASDFGETYIGSMHVLLGLTKTTDTDAAKILARFGVNPDSLLALASPSFDTTMRRLLLISNSTMHGGGYLEHCATEIRELLGGRKKVMFVPFALHDHDAYARKAHKAFAAFGHDLASAHQVEHPTTLLDHCDAVFVGGGNTFRLLDALYSRGLGHALQRRVRAGMPYIGSSAGTNVATLSIRTTNDMPIVQPVSFEALALVPFQINPHYLDPSPDSTHMGETREDRIRQFHEENTTPVLGLREGAMLRVDGDGMQLRGTTGARLFRRGAAPQEFSPPCDLSFLLQP